MIFEVAGIISAISSINQAVSLARDTQQTAATVGDMISNLTNAESRILAKAIGNADQRIKSAKEATLRLINKINVSTNRMQHVSNLI